MAPEQCIVLRNRACPKSQIIGSRSSTFKSQKPIKWRPVRNVLTKGESLYIFFYINFTEYKRNFCGEITAVFLSRIVTAKLTPPNSLIEWYQTSLSPENYLYSLKLSAFIKRNFRWNTDPHIIEMN
jgi:hypothetical protein